MIGLQIMLIPKVLKPRYLIQWLKTLGTIEKLLFGSKLVVSKFFKKIIFIYIFYHPLTGEYILLFVYRPLSYPVRSL